ncbi:hypothetical protein KAW44_00780 [Candidatus Bipolaricaulota bacterium]|nr:hypothetical protein [Candidatus Bipolaricaulota bacterium]
MSEIAQPYSEVNALALMPNGNPVPAELTKSGDFLRQWDGYGSKERNLLHLGQLSKRIGHNIGGQAEVPLSAEHILILLFDLLLARSDVTRSLPTVLGYFGQVFVPWFFIPEKSGGYRFGRPWEKFASPRFALPRLALPTLAVRSPLSCPLF